MSQRTAVHIVDSRKGKTFVRLALVPHTLSEIAAGYNDTYFYVFQHNQKIKATIFTLVYHLTVPIL